MGNLSQHFPASVLLKSGLAHSLLGARPEHYGVIYSIPGLHPPVVTTKNVSRCCQVSSGYKITLG